MPEAPVAVVVLGERGGWHARGLVTALRRAGIGARMARFEACGIDLSSPAGLRLRVNETLPRAVIVRSIPAGTFEQVTLRLGLLHALEAAGVVVVNAPRAIERCVDKAATSWLLARAGLPTPVTLVVEDQAAAAAFVAAEAAIGHEVVVKPLFGSQGRGLRRIGDADALPPAEEVAGVWYLQRYVGAASGWCDFRVLVVAGRPLAAMRRRGQGWVTNIRQGAVAEAVPERGMLGSMAVAAAAAVGAFIAGVDLIDGPDGPMVLEVNSMPAWQGLQQVVAIDIARAIATAVVEAAGLVT